MRRIAGINLKGFDASNLGTAFEANGGARFEAGRVVKLRMVHGGGSGKDAGQDEHREDQERDGDNNKDTDKDLLTPSIHLYLLFP